jgi:hypothetical protein
MAPLSRLRALQAAKEQQQSTRPEERSRAGQAKWSNQFESGPAGCQDRCLSAALLLSGLEELDWIPVGIFDLDLSAAGTSLHLIAKL